MSRLAEGRRALEVLHGLTTAELAQLDALKTAELAGRLVVVVYAGGKLRGASTETPQAPSQLVLGEATP